MSSAEQRAAARAHHLEVLAENPEWAWDGHGHEVTVRSELARLGIQNDPEPETCPRCGGPLEESGGYVGETILFCPAGCGVAWEDNEAAIRNCI